MSLNGEAQKTTEKEEKLLNLVIDLGLLELKPRRTGHSIVYEGLEQLTNEVGGKEVRRMLKSLVSKGFLEEKGYDSAVACPNCDSISILSKYSCPQCESVNVRKVQLIEHPFCGYIGNRSEFDVDGELVCPKCKTPLGSFWKAQSKNQGEKSSVIKVIGSSFVCDKCGGKFEKPVVVHSCDRCVGTFTYKEANYEKLPSYALTKKVEELAPRRIAIAALRQVEKLLAEKGYVVELDAKIKGRSGIIHSFNLAARKEAQMLIFEVSTWGNQNDLIALFGKKMDVDIDSIILLNLSVNPNLTALGKPYNIIVIDGRDEKFIDKIAMLLGDGGKKEEDKPGASFKWAHNPFQKEKKDKSM